MPINFPASLDNFTNPTAADNLNSATVPHADQHSNINDAVEALEAKVGINGSLVTGSFDYRISQLESSGHSPVTLGTANGLSLVGQQLSLSLSATGTTGALSGLDYSRVAWKNEANVFTALQTVDMSNSSKGLSLKSPAPYVTATSFTSNASSDEWEGHTARQVINSAQITNTGLTLVRVSIKASATSALNVTKCYIGMAAAAGDAYDFATTPTQVTFNNGSAGFSASAGVTTVSDDITFTIAAGQNLIISMFLGSPSGFASKATQTGYSLYYVVGDDAATVNTSGYSNDAGSYDALGVILIESGSNTSVEYFAGAHGYASLPTQTASQLLALDSSKRIISSGVTYPSAGTVALLGVANVFTAAQTIQGNIATPLTLDRTANSDVSFNIKNSIYTFGFTQRSTAFGRPGVAQFNLSSGQDMEILHSSGAVVVYFNSVNRRMSIGITSATVPCTLFPVTNTTTTNAVAENTRLQAVVSTASTGASNGFGVGLTWYAETATNDTHQQQGAINTSWVDATNASRKAKMSLSAYDTAARLGIEIEASGTAAKLGFFGATPIVRQAHIVDADGTLADITTKFNSLLAYLENFGFIATS